MHADSELSKTTQDYASIEKLLADVDESKGFWGIAFADHDTEKVYLSKKYYGFGQLSRYIRPGYSIIPTGDDKNMIAAYDDEGKKVVIVALNTSAEDETRTFDLSEFTTMGSDIQAIRTSGTLEDGENWADVTDTDEIYADTDENTFSAVLKANSITTYIVDGVCFGEPEPTPAPNPTPAPTPNPVPTPAKDTTTEKPSIKRPNHPLVLFSPTKGVSRLLN
jgi:hypothetical protein